MVRLNERIALDPALQAVPARVLAAGGHGGSPGHRLATK
jgi:hypothetical protein